MDLRTRKLWLGVGVAVWCLVWLLGPRPSVQGGMGESDGALAGDVSFDAACGPLGARLAAAAGRDWAEGVGDALQGHDMGALVAFCIEAQEMDDAWLVDQVVARFGVAPPPDRHDAAP